MSREATTITQVDLLNVHFSLKQEGLDRTKAIARNVSDQNVLNRSRCFGRLSISISSYTGCVKNVKRCVRPRYKMRLVEYMRTYAL